MFKHLENRRWKTHCCFNFPSMCVGAAAAGAVAASRVRCAVNAVIYNKLLYTKQTSLSLFVLSVCLFNTTSTSSTTKKCPFFFSLSLCLSVSVAYLFIRCVLSLSHIRCTCSFNIVFCRKVKREFSQPLHNLFRIELLNFHNYSFELFIVRWCTWKWIVFDRVCESIGTLNHLENRMFIVDTTQQQQNLSAP